MKIALEAVPNIDFTNDDRRVALHTVEVKTIAEAQTVMNNFIVDNGLGGGNFTKNTGMVYDDNGEHVATISYNLRVWDTEGQELRWI